MRTSVLFLAAAALSVASCKTATDAGGSDATPPLITALPRALSVGETQLASATGRFGPALLARVNATSADENIFISPLSASMALGMALNGADGDTRTEMQAALGLGALSRETILSSSRALIDLLRTLDPQVDFRIANAIWYEQAFAPSIAPNFLSEAQQYFDATAQGLNFSAPASVTTVNDWVKSNTDGKIPGIVDRFPDNLVMLLVNAIYFKGDWRSGFSRDSTRNEPFVTTTGSPVQVPMMHRTMKGRAGTADGRTVAEFGYGGDAFVMSLILPRAGESVDALVESLGANGWDASVAALRSMDVELSLPRFSMSWQASLNDPLKALGMQKAFIPGGADFSRLSPSEGERLYIDFVKQRTFVDVNEVGTVAAAVTAVGVGVVSLPERMVVRVDRPFVFAIRERLSGTILFLGKIVEPPTT